MGTCVFLDNRVIGIAIKSEAIVKNKTSGSRNCTTYNKTVSAILIEIACYFFKRKTI